jgi:predicted transcriptional regulator
MSEIELSDAAPEGSVLRVRVGPGGLAEMSAMAVRAAAAAESGQPFTPYFALSFAEMGEMLAAFTPKRWALIAALRSAGPSSVRALAQHLQRDYKNVHTDVAALEQWMVLQRMPDGRVHVPWAEVVLEMHLPEALAA